MNQSRVLKMILSHDLLIFLNNNSNLQNECLRVNKINFAPCPSENRFFGFCPLRVFTHREGLAFAFQKDTSAASAIAFCFCLWAFNNKKSF